MKLTDIIKWHTNNKVWKRAYKRIECDKTGKCGICPWHGGENKYIGRKPRPDKYKNKR